MRIHWVIPALLFACDKTPSFTEKDRAALPTMQAKSASQLCTENMDRCDIHAVVAEKENDFHQAYEKNVSSDKKSEAGLELQKWYLIQARLKDSSSADIATIHSDYKILQEIEKIQLAQESVVSAAGYEYVDEPLPIPLDRVSTPKKDVYRLANYHRQTAQDVAKVIEDFGELYVTETPDKQMKNIEIPYPGQGYFAPIREIKGQLAGSGGPYDKMMRAIHYLYPEIPVEKVRQDLEAIKKYELEEFLPGYEHTASSSEGFCHIRSLVDFWFDTRTPRKIWNSSHEKFVELTQMDQFLIALASYTKAYRASDSDNMMLTYGTMYEAGVETDGQGQGLKPEAVVNILSHVLSGDIPPGLQPVLGTGPMGAIVDVETNGASKWNQPTFRLGLRIERPTADSPLAQYAYEGRAYMEYATHLSKITDVPKARNDGGSRTKNLTFWLYFNPNEPLKGGKRRVIGSSWTKESWVNHPNVIRLLPKDLVARSHNEKLNSLNYLPLITKSLLIRKNKTPVGAAL
jgi:hypothetical protein